jgi:hypothetical protein
VQLPLWQGLQYSNIRQGSKLECRLCVHIFKNKNHDLSAVTFAQGNQHLLGGFSHCFDTFGAEYFMYLAALFHHQRLLQVRFELTIGGSLGEGTRVPEGCGLSTMCAFSHVRETSFLAIIPKFKCPF